MIPVALTVAGSDCTGGAGIQADLKTFAALGVYGESVITSVVAENTCRVFSRQDISPEMVTAQLDAVYQDIPPHAVKLGMLPTIEVVETVADWLAAHPKQPVVTDPVLVEEIRAGAGLDIGGTLIGMHLRRVAVPVRLSFDHIGKAHFLCARCRPKYIGGERAVYRQM